MLLLLCLLVTASATAQEPNTTTREVFLATARVDRIDRFSRAVTLRTDQGMLQTVFVPPELKVFDELQPGDAVTVRLIESVIVAVRPNAKPTVIEDTTAAARKEQADNREVQQQLKAVVTIESVDIPKQLIIYKTGDNRRVMRAVADPHLLEGLKAGDVIEVTYTRERAIELEKRH